MYRAVLTKGECPIVGHDPFEPGEDDWLPPKYIFDVLSGNYDIYHKGRIRPATKEECRGLEREAVWDLPHIVDRIVNGENSKFLRSLRREGDPS
jgi:hypothetical protein